MKRKFSGKLNVLIHLYIIGKNGNDNISHKNSFPSCKYVFIYQHINFCWTGIRLWQWYGPVLYMIYIVILVSHCACKCLSLPEAGPLVICVFIVMFCIRYLCYTNMFLFVFYGLCEVCLHVPVKKFWFLFIFNS